MAFCATCGGYTAQGDVVCAACGAQLSGTSQDWGAGIDPYASVPRPSIPMAVDNGGMIFAGLPAFNWAAFLWGFIWALFHGQWIWALVILIIGAAGWLIPGAVFIAAPLLWPVIPLLLGIWGYRLAAMGANPAKYSTGDDLIRSQRAWALWYLVPLILSVLAGCAAFFAFMNGLYSIGGLY